jgi:integrase
MALAHTAVLKAVSKDIAYKLSDGGGLHLLVQPGGSKLWRFRYRYGGKENMLALGSFPEVSLAAARTRRDDAKKLLSNGTDPSAQRKLDKVSAAIAAANTFGAISAEYLERLKEKGCSEKTIEKNKWLLEDLAAPLKDRPISLITPAELLIILQKVEKTGRRESARRLRGIIGTVFRFAVVTLRAKDDPTYALRGALLPPIVEHRAAITDEVKLGGLMRAIDEYDGWVTLRAALLFLALTMTRPGDVRHMRRSEIIFPRALWRIPAERTKMRRPHDVPLSRQALIVLREIWEVSNSGNSDFVFSSIRSLKKPLSENAMNSALRRMGYEKHEMTAHGFRSSASTILNERGFNANVIEAALSHQEEDDVRRAYNRATYFKERVSLMQEWADLLDQFRVEGSAARVVNLVQQ